MKVQESKIYKANYKFSKIRSCLLTHEDLVKFYKILEKKVQEALEIEIKELQQPKETNNEDYVKLKENIENNFRLSVQIIGINGEQIIGQSTSVFEEENFPDDLRAVTFDSISHLRSNINYIPKNSFDIKLDFSKTRILDFISSANETQNISSIEIYGNNETWVTGVYQKVLEFIKEKRKKRNWLHTKPIYTFALFLIIFPATFWTIFRIDKYIRLLYREIPNVLIIAIYVYIFFFILFVFRIMFNYLKWVFPIIEFKRKSGSKMGKHRWFFSVIFLGLLTAFIYDILRFTFNR